MQLKNLLLPLLLTMTPAVLTPAGATSFQHVIVVVQENRTPDNLFQGLCASEDACSTTPGPGQYNIQTAGWLDKTSPTGTTDPVAVPFGVAYDIAHNHPAFVAMCDMTVDGFCAMDGAALEKCSRACPPEPAFGYVDNSQGAVQPYLDLALSYGWGNYMFQTNQGPSFPAHLFLFTATSAPSADDDHGGTFAAENPRGGGYHARAGCAASANTRVRLINGQGVELGKMFPCFEYTTLTDLLDAQGTSWRYYGVKPYGIWMAPNAINHICVANNGSCSGDEFVSNVDINPPDILSDIANSCSLHAVSWVTPAGPNSDHMGQLANTGGASWVASIVNAVGTSTCTNPDGSSYWDTTAVVVVWDDWGGWYDHEPPTIEPDVQGGYQMGFRVPLIVVSAYTPAATISNTREDFGSVIRFIEQNFGIAEGALTFADARGAGDLTEFFSLTPRSHRHFHRIRAPLSQSYFLKAKRSDEAPDDD